VRVSRIPDDAVPVPLDDGRLVVAYGEATGHAHVVEADGGTASLLAAGRDRFLRLETSAYLRHLGPDGTQADHDPILLATGLYRQVPQVEYVGDSGRVIVD
jgi:hypothetical protein